MSTFSNLLYHIVFGTKHRRDMIDTEIRDRLYAYVGGIIREQKGIVLAIGGMPDHIHILAKLSPTVAVSDVLRLAKTNSSRWVHETFQAKRQFSWQRGYGAFSVSASNVESVCDYIQRQEEHHSRKSFEEEFRQLLTRHGIEFDERHLFDDENIA